MDPSNRLVADALEAEWNEKLRAASEAQEDYERLSREDAAHLDEEQKRRILDLAEDFPRLWQSLSIPQRERKRMARLLVEDVTLVKGSDITACIRFRGGSTKIIALPIPLSAWQLRKTRPRSRR